MYYSNKTKLVTFLCYGITTIIFLVIGLVGVNIKTGEELGYSVLNFYLIMPLTSLTFSLILSLKNGNFPFFYPLFTGFFSILIPYLVFHSFSTITVIFNVIPAFLGLLIGSMFRTLLKQEKTNVD